MGVISVPHRAHGETARTVAERADDAQQPLPETEDLAVGEHRALVLGRRAEKPLPALQDGREPELLRLGGARPLVDAEMPDGIGGT